MSTALVQRALDLGQMEMDGFSEQDLDRVQGVIGEAVAAKLTRSDRIAALAKSVAEELARSLGQPVHALPHLAPDRIARLIDASDLA